MKVLIRYFGDIRDLTGEEQRQWDKPEASLGGLLADLSGLYGSCFEHRVLGESARRELCEAVIILINGHDVRHQGGVMAPLRPDDTVAIFPVIPNGNGRVKTMDTRVLRESDEEVQGGEL